MTAARRFGAKRIDGGRPNAWRLAGRRRGAAYASAAAAGVFALVGAILPAAALAHGADADGPAAFRFWHEWSATAGEVVPFLVTIGIYYGGTLRLWRRAGLGRGVSRGRVGAFTTGLVVLALALMSPLDALADSLFWVHMVQHLLLILVVAPLLVLGEPEIALLWCLPQRWRPVTGRVENRLARAIVGPPEGGGAGPIAVVVVATAVLWAWHLPSLYDLAVEHEGIHTTEHVLFLVTAAMFWATVLRLTPRERQGHGYRVLYVFAMGLQCSVLGAVITFAPRPLYSVHLETAPAWGFSPLVDQQLAGLIMWVPPALLFVSLTWYLFMGWLAAAQERQAAEERRMDERRARARAARAGNTDGAEASRATARSGNDAGGPSRHSARPSASPPSLARSIGSVSSLRTLDEPVPSRRQ